MATSNNDTNLNASERTHPVSESDFDQYNMIKGKGGVAILISNKYPDDDVLKERISADTDREVMLKLLKNMGFDSILGEHKEYGVEDMKELFKTASKQDFTNKNGFACVILSYGDEGYIHGNGAEGDEMEVEVNELLELIKGKNCPSLAGKPKLCILQTCPVDVKKSEQRAEGDSVQEEVLKKLPVEADFVTVHSCIPGSCWWKDESKPSMFVESLDKVIRKNWEDVRLNQMKKLDFLTLMTRVSKEIAMKLNSIRQSDDNIMLKKVEKSKLPSVTSTLTKELFFTEHCDLEL